MPNGNVAGIRDEPDPGTLADPPFNNNVFASGAGFPGGTPGSGKTLTQAVLNGTNAIPVNGNYPPIPAVSGVEWATALDRAVFHILTDGTVYEDLGPNHLNRLDRARVSARLVRRLNSIGFDVQIRDLAA